MAFQETCTSEWSEYRARKTGAPAVRKSVRKSHGAVRKYAHAPFDRKDIERIASNLEEIDRIYNAYFDGRERDFYDQEEGRLFAEIEYGIINLVELTNAYIDKLSEERD